jgi:hypothetical protein
MIVDVLAVLLASIVIGIFAELYRRL